MNDVVLNEIVKAVADCFVKGHRVTKVSPDNPDDPKAIVLRLHSGEELRREIETKDRDEFWRRYQQAATWWRLQWDSIKL